MCCSRKYPHPLPRMFTGNSMQVEVGGGGGLKSQIFEGKYEAELEFLEWGSSSQKTNLRGGGGIMDIFWNHTIHDNFHSKLWLSFFDDGHSLALRLGIQMWALLGGTHVPVCLPSEF